MKNRIAIPFVFALFTLSGMAQDPQYSQFYNAPVYVNPALVGQTRQWKFTLNSRNQWGSTPATYVSNALTAEYNAALNNSALGVQILQDKAGSAKLTYVSYGVIYAYKARLSRRIGLNFGVKPSYNQRYYDRSALRFSSDINESSDNAIVDDLKDRVSYFDMGAGAALVTRTWWAGFSVDHLVQPDYSFGAVSSKLDLKYSAHFLYKFELRRDNKRNVVQSAVLGGNYKGQNEWDQFDFGGYYEFHSVTFGLFYRAFVFQQTVPDNFNHDAMLILLGYRFMGLKLSYSYDVTVSKIGGESGGSHEISIITEYPFNPKKRLRSHRMVPCPKW